MVWKLIHCFLKTAQDFLCWITFTLAYLTKTRCFYILRKKLLLQQMRDYLLCKISTYSPATSSVSAFAVVAVQMHNADAIMHPLLHNSLLLTLLTNRWLAFSVHISFSKFCFLLFFSSLLFLVTIWCICLSFFLAISLISRDFWLSSAKIVLAHLFTMCCSDRSHYCDPGYLAGKYSTMSAIHNLGLIFCYQRSILSFFVALPAQGSDNILPCIPSFTVSTFVLWNTFSNYFAKYLDVFLF